MNCREALLNDLDATSFVKELTLIADNGMTYVEQVSTMNTNIGIRAEEPLRFILDTPQGQLDLVGFTKQTIVNAGISIGDNVSATQKSVDTSIVNETVAFRAAV